VESDLRFFIVLFIRDCSHRFLAVFLLKFLKELLWNRICEASRFEFESDDSDSI